MHQESLTFGPAYDEQIDGPRVATQLERIRGYCLGEHRWRTLGEIAQATGYAEASVSAQLRHLRKPRFGAYDVQKQRRQPAGGTWEYRVLPPTSERAA